MCRHVLLVEVENVDYHCCDASEEQCEEDESSFASVKPVFSSEHDGNGFEEEVDDSIDE